jgi:hypothetical protein
VDRDLSLIHSHIYSASSRGIFITVWFRLRTGEGGRYTTIERLRDKFIKLSDDPFDFEETGSDLEAYGQPPLEIMVQIDEAEAEEKEMDAESEDH